MSKLIKILLVILNIGLFCLISYLSYNIYKHPTSKPKGEWDVGTSKATKIQKTNSPEKVMEAETSFIFAGDLMLDRYVYYKYKDKGLIHIFDSLDLDELKSADFRILNLEGPISKEPTDPAYTDNDLKFNFPPQSIDVLKYLNINAVSLANNHTMNAGEEGFKTTQTLLSNAGIKHAGQSFDFDQNDVINFNSDFPISIITADLLAIKNLETLKETITSQKQKGYFVIVFPHWGEEYKTNHSAVQQSTAHILIDSGADLIIGSHPHVIQDLEVYKEKLIVYSLGNFVFDQSFSEETQLGLIVKGTLDRNSVKYEFMPISLKNIQPKFLEGKQKEEIISKITQGINIVDNVITLGFN